MKQIYHSLFKAPKTKILGLGFNFYSPVKKIDPPEKPFFFQKSLESLVLNPKVLELVETDSPINHEIELGVMISKRCYNINANAAYDFIGGYFLLLDLTRASVVDWRKKGASWCIAKSAENFLPVSDFISKNQVDDPHNLDLMLKVFCIINGQVRQEGNTSQMIFNIPEQISFISKYMALNEGDLILTGTPDGISTINNGDQLHGTLKQKDTLLAELNIKVNTTKLNQIYIQHN